MGTQAGLDFCSKLAKLNRGKADQKYPLFVLYNKSNIPDRKQNLKKYNKVLKSLIEGCKFLQKNKCKFISIPCNTAHYWYKDLIGFGVNGQLSSISRTPSLSSSSSQASPRPSPSVSN